MLKKPIEIFKNNEQFQNCCEWWKHKLFLDDWFIVFNLIKEPIIIEDGSILSGQCEYEFNNKEAKITVSDCTKYDNDSVIRNISELTIIHELLHLKNGFFLDIEDATDKSFHKYIAHQELESMAKTLLMVKYELDYNYFTRGGTSGKEKKN